MTPLNVAWVVYWTGVIVYMVWFLIKASRGEQKKWLHQAFDAMGHTPKTSTIVALAGFGGLIWPAIFILSMTASKGKHRG